MKPTDLLGESSSFDSNSISGISIDAIKSILYMCTEYKNMSSDDLKKDINSGPQLQLYRTNDCFEISSTKALKESQYDNLNFSANAVVTKKPTEQDDMVVKAFYTSKYIVPCDGETTDGKSETSNNNGAKKESNKGGEVVSLKCQNEVAGTPNNSNGSSGSGGDDEDNRKPHVLKSNCERDDQAAEDDKKDEVEDEEIVANAEESEDDGGSSDDADVDYECEVKLAEERKGIEDISIHGGDENMDAHNQVNNQVSSGQIPSLTCTAREWSDPPPSCTRDTSTVSLDAEVNSEALVHVEKAFTCRHNMRAWEECNDDHCQALQQSLRHSQNCHMRVLGGCLQCICLKDALQSHASTCKELPGKCVVNKCDDIREYMKNNALPDNRNWKYKHDKLLFEPSPPLTVTWPGNLCLLPFDTSESASFESDTDENSSTSATTLQNQCHVREPDFGSDLFSGANLVQRQHVENVGQPTSYCSARSGMASLQPRRVEEEDELPASPLSAPSMPGMNQASGGVSIPQEVLWPLNRAHLSVGDDGSYVENFHWKRIVYIGGGSCGRCYQCIDLKTGKLFAIKIIREDSFEMMGLDIWGTMSGRHDNILELYGAVKSCGKITIFMEYMSGGPVEEAGPLHEGLALNIFSEKLSAVQFMHSLGFVHQDIKDDDEDADDDVDDYGDDVIGVGDGAIGSANAATLDVSSTEGEWQGQRSAALSTEQRLHSLQSDLFFSLPAEELFKLVFTEICEDSYMTDNDVNEVLSSEEDFDYQSIIDLTKVNITDIDGNIMFSIRERPTTTYGTLGRDLHGNITNVFGIEAFVLVQADGVTPLDVDTEIGEHEQGLRVFRAHDTDNWQPFRWRVNRLGLVEQSLRG